MGEGKFTPLTTPTPLNRQSPNIAYVITSTISPHKPHLVKIAPGVTSPYIAKVTTQFRAKGEVLVLLFFVFCTVNDFSATRGPIHAKVCMLAYSGPGCVFSSFGVTVPWGGQKKEQWNFRYYGSQWGIFAFCCFLSVISATCARIHT